MSPKYVSEILGIASSQAEDSAPRGRELNSTPIPEGKVRLFADDYFRHSIDYPDGPSFMGVSFHPTKEARTAWFDRIRHHDKRVYGGRVPPDYYRPQGGFEIAASPEFRDFIERDAAGTEVPGVFVLKTTLRYLTRLDLVDDHPRLQELVDSHCSEFREELMTLDRLFREISEDSRLWRYDTRRQGTYDTGWRTD